MTTTDARQVEYSAMTEKWASSPHEIHKRPPFRAHSFDDDGRYWVVGTTGVSVLHAWHGTEEQAEEIAAALNGTPAVRHALEEQGR